MSLLVVYIVLMIAGAFVTYSRGLGVERPVPAASLPVFLAMYFPFLWTAGVIGVRITASRAQPQ